MVDNLIDLANVLNIANSFSRDIPPFEVVSALKSDLSILQQEVSHLKNLAHDHSIVSPTEIKDAALTTLEGLTNIKTFLNFTRTFRSQGY
jgi:hypothetical protein